MNMVALRLVSALVVLNVAFATPVDLIAKNRPRIINGTPAPKKDADIVPLIMYDDFSGCSGVLISKNLVVTAAHCINKGYYYRNTVEKASSITVGIGLSNIHDRTASKIYGAEAVYYHPLYNADTTRFDIGVIVLNRPVDLHNITFPVLAENRKFMKDGSNQTVIGWGSTKEDDYEPPEVLQRAEVAMVKNTVCNARYTSKSPYLVYPDMVCAGGGKTDTCFGDSGGPLMVFPKSGAPVLNGLTSWGLSRCAVPGVPGVYASMPALRHFIAPAVDVRHVVTNDDEEMNTQGNLVQFEQATRSVDVYLSYRHNFQDDVNVKIVNASNTNLKATPTSWSYSRFEKTALLMIENQGLPKGRHSLTLQLTGPYYNNTQIIFVNVI